MYDFTSIEQIGRIAILCFQIAWSQPLGVEASTKVLTNQCFPIHQITNIRNGGFGKAAVTVQGRGTIYVDIRMKQDASVVQRCRMEAQAAAMRRGKPTAYVCDPILGSRVAADVSRPFGDHFRLNMGMVGPEPRKFTQADVAKWRVGNGQVRDMSEETVRGR